MGDSLVDPMARPDETASGLGLWDARGTQPAPAPAVPGHLAVPLDAIAGDQPLRFALFRKQTGGSLAAFLPAGAVLTDALRACLQPAGPGNDAPQAGLVYVAKNDYVLYREHVETGIGRLLACQPLGSRRYELTYRLVLQLAQEFLESPGEGVVARVVQVSARLAEAVAGGHEPASQLLACRPRSYETAAHMVNVCLLSLMLSHSLELRGGDRATLAAGAFLHDAGKIGMPEAALRKEGRLNQGEWWLIHQHPRRGADWLRQTGLVDSSVVEMAAAHHERLDGQGYPKNLTGGDIHPWARLCAVADTFDLLTGERPFRKALNPLVAAGLMKDRSGQWFDSGMIEALHKLVLADSVPVAGPSTRNDDIPTAGRAGSTAGEAASLESFVALPPVGVTAEPPRGAISDGRNRRHHPRHRFNASCRIRCLRSSADAESHIGFWVNAVDISRGGLQFLHHAPMRLGETISVFLPDHKTGRHLNALVVRCQCAANRLYAIGVRFQWQR